MPALLADAPLDTTKLLLVALAGVTVIGMLFYMQWVLGQRRQQRREEWDQRRQEENQKREEEKFRMEMDLRNVEIKLKHVEAAERELKFKQAEAAGRSNSGIEPDTASSAGNGSGGFIIMDMPDNDRPLFHDLLKGFEDFARLKGYMIAFSIDSTFAGRIAFKFTIKDDGVVVGPERVRRDFAEYVNQVRNKDIDDLDNLPVVTSMEEHNLLVTVLKNRITFLKHSYQLSQNAVQFYERMMSNTHAFPALPAPSVIVHTGGAMDSRNYNAVNSQKVLQGDANTFSDNSINIGKSKVDPFVKTIFGPQ